MFTVLIILFLILYFIIQNDEAEEKRKKMEFNSNPENNIFFKAEEVTQETLDEFSKNISDAFNVRKNLNDLKISTEEKNLNKDNSDKPEPSKISRTKPELLNEIQTKKNNEEKKFTDIKLEEEEERNIYSSMKYKPIFDYVQETKVRHYPLVKMPFEGVPVLNPILGKNNVKGVSEDSFHRELLSFFEHNEMC